MQTKYSLEELKTAIKENISMAATLRQIKLSATTSNYKTIKKYIEKHNFDTSHWLGQSHLKGKNRITKNNIPLQEILIEKSDFSTGALKKRLLKENYLKNNCYICGINEWHGKALSLQIDHINGINNDNRLENLRLLCPNCHSTTTTYCGRNKKRKIYTCFTCGNEKETKNSIYCRKCIPKKTKINWPSKEELENLVWKMPIEEIAKNLGVSGQAIHKKCKKLGINKPNQGYWLIK